MRSSVTDGVVALYPSPAGATECELDLEAWRELVELNPVLDELEPDAEALIVNRMADPPHVRDRADRRCYRLVGLVKIDAGRASRAAPAVDEAVAGYFDELRAAAAPA